MRKLLIATRSKGKFPEIIAGLSGLSFEFLNLNDVSELPSDYEVEEPAYTFEGNAIIKAMTLGKKTGLMTLADDSGLEVDVLDGRPGVYTARYGPGTDEDRYMKLLDELRNVPKEKRTARFQAVIAIYDPNKDLMRTCNGTYEGRIAESPVGEHGFGYDPVFFSTLLKKTTAQMSLEEKNNVSHRGKALKEIRSIIEKDFQTHENYPEN